jgi:hypothetical protein
MFPGRARRGGRGGAKRGGAGGTLFARISSGVSTPRTTAATCGGRLRATSNQGPPGRSTPVTHLVW